MKTAAVVLLGAILSLAAGCTDTLDPTALHEIRVEPEVGTYLRGCEGAGTHDWGYDAGEPTYIVLTDLRLSICPCDEEYSTHLVSRDIDLQVGDPCLVVSGRVGSHEEEKRQVSVFALGFDEVGQETAETLDSEMYYGCVMFDIEPGQTCEFVLHLNPSAEIRTIRVFGSSYKEEPSEPSTSVPESEMTHLTFSRKWLLENNAEPSSDLIKITFPAWWLQQPPEIPEDEETAELSVPMRLLMDHNTSENPDEITVAFPSHYFNGLTEDD